MGVYKQREREQVYHLFTAAGISDVRELSRRCNLSKGLVTQIIRSPEAIKDARERVREAKRLYVEEGIGDVDIICSRARITHELWQKIYRIEWDDERAVYLAENPALYRTGDLLYQAAEDLIMKVRTTGYSDENIDKLVKLANAYEQFRTGEFKMQSIILGMAEFVSFFRDNAKRLGVKRRTVNELNRIVEAFRTHVESRLAEL